MRIIRINLFECNTPFKFGFHSPHTLRLKAESIVVQLQFDNGISGYGESAPRLYVTGETRSTVSQMIQNHFSEILFCQEINSIEDIENTLSALENKCFDHNILAYNSALGAIDIALLDALGKFHTIPTHHFLGPIIRNETPYSLAVPLLPFPVIQKLHHYFKELEFGSLKVLLNDDENDTIERLSFIRSIFGIDIEIRIEANGRWTRQQAISTIEKLKRFDISAVEQPVAKGDIEGLQAVRDTTKIPVIADESMCSLSDAKKLINSGACDILNIKISKCGGLLKSKEIAEFAQSRDVPCQLGAHVGETEILNSAGKYFALTTSNLKCFEGYSSLLFENSWKWNKMEKGVHRKNDLSHIGLGVDLRNHTLQKICTLYPA
ncbi:hypothetical protein J7K93_06085 [bacterium]|nr:hypothetical protein [bacterium]